MGYTQTMVRNEWKRIEKTQTKNENKVLNKNCTISMGFYRIDEENILKISLKKTKSKKIENEKNTEKNWKTKIIQQTSVTILYQWGYTKTMIKNWKKRWKTTNGKEKENKKNWKSNNITWIF